MGRVWWGGERRGFKKIAMPNAKISTKHIFQHIFTDIFGPPTKNAHSSANTAMLRANKVPIRMSRSHALQLARYHGRFRRFWSKICTYRTRIAEKRLVRCNGPETAKNGKSLIQRVRLANADVNRSQVLPEHVSGGGARSVLASRSVSKVMRIEW